LSRFQPPNKRSAWNLDNQITARAPVHSLAQSRPASGGDQAGIKELRDQVVKVVIGLEDDIAAAAAVSAAGAAFGAGRLPEKGHAAFAPVPRPGEDSYFINKHDFVSSDKKGEADSPRREESREPVQLPAAAAS
jgi:hypothetical protein